MESAVSLPDTSNEMIIVPVQILLNVFKGGQFYRCYSYLTYCVEGYKILYRNII